MRVLPAGLSVTVRVPASSANLGPGFDSLAIALGIHDEIEVETTDSATTVHVDGEGADEVPWDSTHLVVRAVQRGLSAHDTRAVGLRVKCRNAIPHARGLGSSAAAVVGGLAAARALAAHLDTGLCADNADLLVQLASEFEGHPDNAAASVLGGMVVAWTENPSGAARDRPGYRAIRLTTDPLVRPVVLVPPCRSSTSETRGFLPEFVPHRDAAFAAGRAALAVAALTSRPDLLMAATEDRLHQDYRAAAWPLTAHWVARLREAGLASTVSGAGPTILTLCTDEFPAELRELATTDGFAVVEPGLADGVRVM
ncbi:homoserine kinase [Nocardia yunnanensis]|uniref:Homoserine kinase n=1 Tax=Nocardia yunnanensis TaxID=2382165 RepID=A0A386ZSF5_9NOCA|nr:homoserine kinase [Nocardia yunnanensis]AYF79405.1 homoserine kinase [Nocardia yunnanensis]